MNLTEKGLHYLRGFHSTAEKFRERIPFLMLTMCGPEDLITAALQPPLRFGYTHNLRYPIGPHPFLDYGQYWGAILIASYPTEVRRGGWITDLAEQLVEHVPEGVNWAISLWLNNSPNPICIDAAYLERPNR